MLRSILAALLLAAAGTASAQTIYRCVENGRPVSFQTEPCSPRARTASARPYTPEPSPTANELAWKRYNTEVEMRSRGARASSGAAAGHVIVASPGPADGVTCSEAKARRDDWERNAGRRGHPDRDVRCRVENGEARGVANNDEARLRRRDIRLRDRSSHNAYYVTAHSPSWGQPA